MKSVLAVFSAGMVMMACAMQARGDAFDDAAKQINAAYGKINAYRAKISTNQDLDMNGMKMKADSTGYIEWKRQGEGAMMRSEMRAKSVQSFGGQEMKNDTNVLVVADGQFMYTLSEILDGQGKGTKTAMKTKAPLSKSAVEDLRKDNEVKMLPDEKVDGQNCYVMEAKAKSQPGTAPAMTDARFVWYFRKDVGIPIKTVMFMKDKVQSTSHTTNIELNPSLGADRFKFDVPKGVQMMDLTKQQDMSGGGDEKAQPTKGDESKPADAKKDEQPKKDADQPKTEDKPKRKLPKLPRLP